MCFLFRGLFPIHVHLVEEEQECSMLDVSFRGVKSHLFRVIFGTHPKLGPLSPHSHESLKGVDHDVEC